MSSRAYCDPFALAASFAPSQILRDTGLREEAARLERFRCFSCARWTDEVKDGPSPEAEAVAQAFRWDTGVLDIHGSELGCRAAVACWVCFWRTEPDLWISPGDWAALNPRVPYEKLPAFDHSDPEHGSDPANYPWPSAVPFEEPK